MKYALLILLLLQSSLSALELVVGPGSDADALLSNKPIDFLSNISTSGGWARTDKGDVECGACVYTDPHGRFSVGWKHLAGKVTRIYYSRGPKRIDFNEKSAVKVNDDQEINLDTETGALKVVPKAKHRDQKQNKARLPQPLGPPTPNDYQ